MLCALIGCLTAALAAETTLDLSGTVPLEGPDHVLVPFEVPDGTVEIEVAHSDGSDAVILDWGLDDPDGFRGWGGGNPDNVIVNEHAASRSYLAGPLPTGTWNVVIGKAKLQGAPAPFTLSVTLRDSVTLAPDPDLGTYTPVAALDDTPRWYAGDFHVHSAHSGDARPNLDEVATFAASRGLDFVVLTEHNTTSHLQVLHAAQARHPEVLLVPGIEVTTYGGHANAIGVTSWVNHRIGLDGQTAQQMADEVTAQGALFSINHPTFDLGELCIGCAWTHGDLEGVTGYEIATGAADSVAGATHASAIDAWTARAAMGLNHAALGGSDDHQGGQGTGLLDSPLGSPTTMVYAERLDVAAILEGIRQRRTVVKLGGPTDPMVEITSDDQLDGGEVFAPSASFDITVTDGMGGRLLWIVDGGEAASTAIDAEPFSWSRSLSADAGGASFARAEVWLGNQRRTVTSHVWLNNTVATDTDLPLDPQPEACGCAGAPSSRLSWLVALLGCIAVRRRAHSM